MLIYLHGFRSSPASFKARMLAARMAALGREADYACPQLPVSPSEAVARVASRWRLDASTTLVGSSLGGCYATYLAERHGCRAVLLNPATRPSVGLAAHLGPQTGYHDPSAAFELRAEHLEELRRIEVAAITRPERYFLIAATGDELLDWREMVAAYPGARHTVVQGGDHGLSDFADHLDDVLAFAGIPPAR